MIETVEGNAGTIVPPDGYLTAVRQLCSKYNVLFIADEIQSGFGRTGYFMAYDCENIKPDMVVLGKSLTGGAYSMGLTLGSRESIGTFKPGQYVVVLKLCVVLQGK
jgi:ornithine--oxo-acid transaminase